MEILDRQGLVCGFDIELEVTVGTEPQRLPLTRLPAVRKKGVDVAADALARDLIPVPLLVIRVDKGFSIGQGDPGSLTTAGHQHRIGGGELGLVQQQGGPGIRGHHQGPFPGEERPIRFDPLNPGDFRNTLNRLLHGRDSPGDQFPGFVDAAMVSPAGERLLIIPGLQPIAVVIIALLPIPGVAAGIDLFTRSHHDICPAKGGAIDRDGGVGLVANDLPVGVGIDKLLLVGVPL
ncbi:hypothetical protein ES703_17385 [subsurface metagenome]